MPLFFLLLLSQFVVVCVVFNECAFVIKYDEMRCFYVFPYSSFILWSFFYCSDYDHCSLSVTLASIRIRFASFRTIIVLNGTDWWLCITFENNNNHFFCFVCHMFCCLVGLLCAARSFLKHTSATVHNCCCWCLLFSYVSQHKYAIDSLLNAIFIKMPHFGGKCWKREKQAILELTHGHRSHIQMPNVVQPEHINWVLQSAFDSNQSCD